MGFRFRKSIKLFPGIRWNIGSKSSSLSFGVRGSHYTIGPHGTRSTIGIPGTGISYTEFHSAHKRVAARHPSIPMPSDQWLRENRIAMTLHTPDRGPGEAPMRPDQLEEIRASHAVPDESQLKDFGERQAENLLGQIHHQQKEASKVILKKFYAQHGHAVPDDFIDHAYDHPDRPYKPPYRWGCFSTGVAAIAIYVFIVSMSSIIRKNFGDSSSETSVTPAPSAVATPSAPLPDPRYWPSEVRISIPVVLSGMIDGEAVTRTAKPGAVLDATLSPDRRTVSVRRPGLSGSLPVQDTDFLERAVRAREEASPTLK